MNLGAKLGPDRSQELIKDWRGSLSDQLDPAVVKIPDLTRDAPVASKPLRSESKTNALDPP